MDSPESRIYKIAHFPLSSEDDKNPRSTHTQTQPETTKHHTESQDLIDRTLRHLLENPITAADLACDIIRKLDERRQLYVCYQAMPLSFRRLMVAEAFEQGLRELDPSAMDRP